MADADCVEAPFGRRVLLFLQLLFLAALGHLKVRCTLAGARGI
jgi:hypothetical protein